MKRRKKYGKIIIIVVLSYLVYVIAGALLPFAFPKKISGKEKEKVNGTGNTGSAVISNDRAVIIEDNVDALDLRIQMIQGAREKIILSTFDIRPDSSSRDIFAALQNAAERGVKVKVFVDGLYGTIHMKRDSMFFAAGGHENIEIKFYNIPDLLRPWSFNGRMHDKYILIDNKLMLAGGRNTFDYFLGENNDNNPSYDREVLIYNAGYKDGSGGSVIGKAEEYFNLVWNLDTSRTVYNSVNRFKSEKVQAAAAELRKNYKKMEKYKPELFKEVDYEKLTTAVDSVVFLHNPVSTYAKEPDVWEQIQAYCMEAKERVYIQSPYVVLSSDMEKGMKQIAEKVGQFFLQVNSAAVGDNFMASSDYMLRRKDVLGTGVSLYEFQGDYSSHGKSILIDDTISMIGSYNLDMRSTYVNTEVILVIKGKEFNKQLESKIMDLHEQSLEVEPDGCYAGDGTVEAVPLPDIKKLILYISGFVFQLFRYLI